MIETSSSSNLFLLSVNPMARIKQSDLKSLSSALPCVVAWKDKNSAFSGVSDRMIDYFDLPVRDKVLGYRDRDVSPLSEFSDFFVKNDRLTMKSARPFVFFEDARNGDGDLIDLIVSKYPIYDDDEKKIIGVFLNAIPIDNSKTKSMVQQVNRLCLPKSLTVVFEHYSFEFNGRTLSFSKKETRVFYHYLRGCTSKEIGKRLRLSYRTIEDYISTIKAKLQLETRSAIVEFAIHMGVFDYVPYSELESFGS